MKKIKLILASLLFVASVSAGGVALVSSPALAAPVPPEQSACEGSGGTWTGTWPNGSCTQGPRTVAGTIKSVGNVLIFLTGAIAVLMIIIGGVRYVVSGGDQGSISGAKNTILYAVIGLIVAVAAYAIVNLVLTNV
jgi:hypothetical protein